MHRSWSLIIECGNRTSRRWIIRDKLYARIKKERGESTVKLNFSFDNDNVIYNERNVQEMHSKI